jgi:two-component system, OmpR family, phosphate regulon sensor histidine kinase PhoR
MFGTRRLVWQIIPVNILTIVAVILAVGWYGATSFKEFYLQETEKDLLARAHLITPLINEMLLADRPEELRRYTVLAGRGTVMRITVILADGLVIADSNEAPGAMDNHSRRPEIEPALRGEVGKARRYSRTVGESMVYVAIPLGRTGLNGELSLPPDYEGAVLRTSMSVASLEKALQRIQWRVALGAAVVLLVAGLITLLVVRNISRPLEEMTRNAEQFSRGDFSERMLVKAKDSGSYEVATLATAMDRMAELLDEKIQAIITHRNQLETVFSSMVEAVIAIDREERVISLNTAAADLFSVDLRMAPGRIVQEIIRNVRLQQQIGHCLSTRQSIEDEIVLTETDGDRYLHSHVVSLSNSFGEHVGVLLVINDVTRLRRLENVRRDFVANVSHELRTPITSILGYVETLLDGALDNRDDAVKFLEIVLRQSQRLTGIIDDLLALSRIEEDSRKGEIRLSLGLLAPVINAAVQTCQLKADQAGVTLVADCPKDLAVLINSALLEQALVNLLVNGIKYSKAGSEVRITAVPGETAEDLVTIRVDDHGCGIAKEHLPRLFERFYRSDQARSRALGGTGLGLAIVKHIAQAHRGAVEVSSVEGEGTTFILRLQGQSSQS